MNDDSGSLAKLIALGAKGFQKPKQLVGTFVGHFPGLETSQIVRNAFVGCGEASKKAALVVSVYEDNGAIGHEGSRAESE